MVNERLDGPLSFAKARASGAATIWREEGELGKCVKCSVPIDSMDDVGYMGSKDRSSEECNPFVDFEVVCVRCEGKSLVC